MSCWWARFSFERYISPQHRLATGQVSADPWSSQGQPVRRNAGLKWLAAGNTVHGCDGADRLTRSSYHSGQRGNHSDTP